MMIEQIPNRAKESFSSLGKFSGCKRNYQLSYTRAWWKGTTPEAACGNAVHSALSSLISGRCSAEEVADRAHNLVLSALERATEIVQPKQSSPWAVKAARQMAAVGAKVYQSWVERGEKNFRAPARFSVKLDGEWEFIGSIDCLSVSPEGRTIIRDFKTGCKRGDDRRQLLYYAAALRAFGAKKPITCEVVYLATDEVDSFDVTEEDIASTVKEILARRAEIEEEREFAHTTSSFCHWCPWSLGETPVCQEGADKVRVDLEGE